MKEDTQEKTPHWKQDFPIEQKAATHVSRREFAKFLGLLSGALAVGNAGVVVRALAFPEQPLEGEHLVCRADQVGVGQMFQFQIEGEKTIPYILIHLGQDEWRAYEQKCTHLGCAVLYDAQQKLIVCPCHKGYFNPENGDVVAGPPPRPLPQLAVVLRDGQVYVKAENHQASNQV